MIDSLTMRELSPEALLRLACQHEALSQELRAAAERKAAALSMKQKNKDTLNELRAIPDIVAGYEATGMSRDAAMDAAGTAAGVDARCVEAHMVLAGRKAKARARQARDAELFALHAEGLSARQIAERTGVHFTTVARIVRRAGA